MISIINLTRCNIPKISWQKIAKKILKNRYSLSLVFAPDSLMKKLNIRYRKVKKSASVLTFPLSKNEGEIFINISQKKYLPLYLFIHALLHLKNFEHGVKMKVREQVLMKKYGKGNNNWN